MRCECGKRLADFFVIENGRGVGVDGARFVKWQEAHRDYSTGATWGIKNIAHEDWWRVVCPKCGRDHRGRDRELVGLVTGAERRGARDTTLGLERPHAGPSRDW